MSSSLTLEFLGTRGSLPVSGPEHVETGGETSSIRVSAGEREIILDAGSGLRAHGQRIVDEHDSGDAIERSIFLSHAHFDHLIGLPYFAPLHRSEASIRIWGPRTPHVDSFAQIVEQFIHPPYFPVPFYEFPADIELSTIRDGDLVYWTRHAEEPIEGPPTPDPPDAIDLEVHTLRGYSHPTSGVYHYKIVRDGDSIVYATDTEAYRQGDRRLIDFAEGADVLIHDAMYTEEEYTTLPVPTQGYGHSTVRAAADVARRADVEQLLLFHHAPSRSDDDLSSIEATGQSYFEHTRVARDGMTLDL